MHFELPKQFQAASQFVDALTQGPYDIEWSLTAPPRPYEKKFFCGHP